MSKTDTDVLVIGAGVVGLAVSYFFSKNNFRVILIEKEKKFGTGVSSRNTEVIHAGIYYKKNSLKGSLCIRGKNLLYEHCKKYNVPHKQIGKFFIINDEENYTVLERINKQAKENGVMDLKHYSFNDIKKLEPLLHVKSALFSPDSGIIDSHAYMESLLKLSEDNGTTFSPFSIFLDAEFNLNKWIVKLGGRDSSKITSNIVINAAGLDSVEISKKINSSPKIPEENFAKGEYLRYSGKAPFRHIVYPALIPGKILERVDATPDLWGSLRFGPSLQYIKSKSDFNVSSELINRFVPAIKKYFPKLDEKKLNLDIAGIRPKIKTTDLESEDFKFEWGINRGWLDIWGIESPGLTASLAIGEHVFNQVKQNL